KTDLARRRTGEELTQCDQVGEGPVAQPAAARDELISEIADMGDGTAEAGHAEPRKGGKNLERRPGRRCVTMAERSIRHMRRMKAGSRRRRQTDQNSGRSRLRRRGSRFGVRPARAFVMRVA